MRGIGDRAIGGTLLLAASIGLASCSEETTKPAPPEVDLRAILESAIADHGIPGMTAVVVRGDDVDEAVAGVRKLGASDALQREDLWHIGSNTKAVTATLIGVLVERDSLAWNTRILDVFPELAGSVQEPYREATLEQLLSHRAGIQPFTEIEEFAALPELSGPPIQQRYVFTAWLLAQAPAVAPGEYCYSNAGYAIAAAMAERVMGSPWEDLVQELVLSPLGASCTFGWPGRAGPDEPWGHAWDGSTLIPHDPWDAYVLPAVIAPAGDISIRLDDYAVFLRQHLNGLRGTNGIVPAATIQRLHSPVGDYALGWSISARDGQPFSVHFGSAGTFLCATVVCAQRNLAFSVIANAAHPETEAGIAEVMDWIWAQAGDEASGGDPHAADPF